MHGVFTMKQTPHSPLRVGRTALLIFGCATVTFASDAGRDWGVERECYPDPVTGVQICEMATNGIAQNLYFHFPNVTADNRYLIFDSDRTGKFQVFRADLETGRIVQLTDVPGGVEARGQAHGVCPHRSDPRRVFYVVPAGEVFVVNVETAASRRIGVIPPPHFGRFLQPTLSHDGRALTFGLQRDAGTWEIGMMDLETGACRVVLRQGFNVSHIQHSPTDPLIFYVWETGGYAPQRTWVVNPDGTGNHPFYFRPPKKDAWLNERKELITHESWVQKTGDMTMISIKAGILLVNKKGEGRMLAEGDFLHCAAQPDGKRVVADDTQGRLWLVDAATGKKRLLATGLEPWKVNGFHPHPTFDFEGRRLIFNTARYRPTVAIIDLAALPPEEQ